MKGRSEQTQLLELTAVFENETIFDNVYLSEIDLLESYLRDELIELLRAVKSC